MNDAPPLRQLLWPGGNSRVESQGRNRWYAVIDGAQDPRLFNLIGQCRHQVCLISGELEPVMAPVLPWLIAFDPDEALMQTWKMHGRGANWGIMLQSPLDLLHVKLHLKKFLNAILPDGRVVLFRFYDPRVFRSYICAATAEERQPWFQHVSRYWIESDQSGKDHDFTLREGRLFDGPVPAFGSMA